MYGIGSQWLYLCVHWVSGECHRAVRRQSLLLEVVQAQHFQRLGPPHLSSVDTLHHHHLVLLEREPLVIARVAIKRADEFGRLFCIDYISHTLVHLWLALLFKSHSHGSVQGQDKFFTHRISDCNYACFLEKVYVVDLSSNDLCSVTVESFLNTHTKWKILPKSSNQFVGC